NQILSKETVAEMLKEQKKPYGIGFSLEEAGGSMRFGHGGADEGFQAAMSATMDGQGYVIMTNSDNGSRLAGEMELSIAAAYGWSDKPREREAITLPKETLDKLAGTYDLPQIGKVRVRVVTDHLLLS